MADEVKTEAEVVAEAPAKIAEAVAETAETIVRESAKTAKRERAAVARKTARKAIAPKAAARRSKPAKRKTRTAARKTAAAQERIETVTNNYFNAFDGSAFAPFQNLFAEANERSQELVKKSQKVAEELAHRSRPRD